MPIELPETLNVLACASDRRWNERVGGRAIATEHRAGFGAAEPRRSGRRGRRAGRRGKPFARGARRIGADGACHVDGQRRSSKTLPSRARDLIWGHFNFAGVSNLKGSQLVESPLLRVEQPCSTIPFRWPSR